MKKHKFNILDFFIILVLAIAFFSVCWKVFDFQDLFHGRNYAQVEYTLEVKGVRDVSVQALQEGDVIFEEDMEIGVIEKIDTREATVLIQKADGSYVEAARPDRFDLEITVQAEGLEKEEGVFIDGKRSIGVGSGIIFNTNKITCEGVVTQISVDNSEK